MLYRKTFKNCSELPLFNFVRVLTREDYSCLISDSSSWRLKPNLHDAWDSIFMEYTELSQDKQGNHIFHLIKDLKVLENKINLIQFCIDTLAKGSDLSKLKPTIDTLKTLAGVSFPFTEETLFHDLNRTAKASKRFVIQYEETLSEYKKLSKSEQAKATEMDFMDHITYIKETLGISFDIRNISVMEYVSLTKRVKEKSESK